MAKTREPSEEPQGEDAIHRVLEAEREARDAVTAANRRAEALLEDARSTVRRVHARADRRAARLHRSSRDGVARRIAEMKARTEAEEQRVGATEVPADKLRAAIDDVARMLTGGDDEP